MGSVDETTSGIRPGEFWVIGALSGRGKTAFATQIAMANVAANVPVAFFSLEMSGTGIACRVLPMQTGVSASRIRHPRTITNEQWHELFRFVDRAGEYPLYVDDAPSLSLPELIARARLYIRRHGCRLIVVDYLRLVEGPGKELRERLANVANGLRQLAKSEEVAVVALSQLARPRAINERPTMLQLKESGDIEAHAHVVLLIHIPVENDEPSGQEEIIIGKNRHGPIGSVPVTFDSRTLTFGPRKHCLD